MSHLDTLLETVKEKDGAKKANIVWAAGLLIGQFAISGDRQSLLASIILANETGLPPDELFSALEAGIKDSREAGNDAAPQILASVLDLLTALRQVKEEEK